jgi:histone H3/H4
MSNYYRHCSICKKPIGFGQVYYRCSVSTCNQKRTGLFFCSVACWDAHVPGARHRDAWAEQTTAPDTQDAQQSGESNTESNKRIVSPRVVGPRGAEPSESTDSDEILVVVSKLKKYVADSADMNTSSQGMAVLSEHLRRVCDRATQIARAEGRKTVLDRDFEKALVEPSTRR